MFVPRGGGSEILGLGHISRAYPISYLFLPTARITSNGSCALRRRKKGHIGSKLQREGEKDGRYKARGERESCANIRREFISYRKSALQIRGRDDSPISALSLFHAATMAQRRCAVVSFSLFSLSLEFARFFQWRRNRRARERERKRGINEERSELPRGNKKAPTTTDTRLLFHSRKMFKIFCLRVYIPREGEREREEGRMFSSPESFSPSRVSFECCCRCCCRVAVAESSSREREEEEEEKESQAPPSPLPQLICHLYVHARAYIYIHTYIPEL